MSKDLKTLMLQAKTIAQQKTPFDTGNLRYNAIKVYKTPTGFRIVSRYNVAPYGSLLDQRATIKGRANKHVGWWTHEANLAVSTFMHANLNDRRNLFQQADGEVSPFAEGDPRRLKRFYNSMVADTGRAKFLRMLGL